MLEDDNDKPDVGAEVSIEEAQDMMKCYFLHVEGDEAPLQTENRRYVTLIADIKETMEASADFCKKHLRISSFEPVPHPETGKQGLAERTLIEGKPEEVVKALEGALMTKEQAAGAVIAGLSQIYERSTLMAGSHTLVFEDDEGPSVTGNTFAPTGVSTEALTVLINAMFGHAQQFSMDTQQKLGKELIVPANGDKEIILPGDPRFRKNW